MLVSPDTPPPPPAPSPAAASEPVPQKPRRRKRSRRCSATALSIAEIHAVPLPDVLAELPGFPEGWQAWTALRHRIHTNKGCWVDVSQIASILSKLAGWYAEGLDVVEAVESGHDRTWQGFLKRYLNPRPGALTTTGISAEAAWQAVCRGLRRGGTPGKQWHFIDDNPDASAAISAAIRDCGRWSDLGRKPAWALDREVKPQFLRRFRSPAPSGHTLNPAQRRAFA